MPKLKNIYKDNLLISIIFFSNFRNKLIEEHFSGYYRHVVTNPVKYEIVNLICVKLEIYS